MARTTIRLDDAIDTAITKASKKIGLNKSEYIRMILTKTPTNISDKINFFANINTTLEQINDNIILNNQLICQLLVDKYSHLEVQEIIENIKKNLEVAKNE
ncbi:CopG family transcriptional regulator [Pectinatus brassicae]|uniref:Antitoxin component of RelBE/YafQ-DinJ toxin-antitoxin module n=1 Tax=Pectinatus brassicae TaxID=862415 RepID=A0A840UXL5_9FIRM|nr:CopG family transcriptional regulator [Pectinatus brassicae]MBB5337603.1 antitoxin component of RelBE/YafQ-DinJ toxin-antitoxin module [Pectinatus brassicae]